MKKLFIIIVVMIFVIGGITQDDILWSFRALLDRPLSHKISEGEYLSKLSLKYYGTTDYWRELALLNRTPDPNLVYPDEKVIIPDFDKIKSIRKAKSLTKVNELVNEIEKTILADNMNNSRTVKKEVPATTVNPPVIKQEPMKRSYQPAIKEQTAIAERSSSPLLYFFVMVGVVLLIGLLVFFYIKHTKNKEPDEFINEDDENDKISEPNKSLKADEVYVN